MTVEPHVDLQYRVFEEDAPKRRFVARRPTIFCLSLVAAAGLGLWLCLEELPELARRWRDALLDVKPLAPDSLSGRACPTHTGGTCEFVGCYHFRGPTICQHDQCLCQPGYCANRGMCLKEDVCDRNTGGTCRLLACQTARGPTICNDDAQCICKPGFCSEGGICALSSKADLVGKVVPLQGRGAAFPGKHAAVSTALAFSGGGTRSLSITLGALRAMENLGIMDGISAISSVSGGSWAAAIYFFAEWMKVDLLGEPTTPGNLTMEALGRPPAALGGVALSDIFGSVPGVLKRGGRFNSRLWVDVVAENILKPFGLNDMTAFLASDAASVERIKRDNPQLEKATFLTPQPGRPPVFIMGGAIISPVGCTTRKGEDGIVSLQISPDFSGSPFYADGEPITYKCEGGSKTLTVGGGLVETFALGSVAPADESGGQTDLPPPRWPFTLADALGIGSAAFAYKMQKLDGTIGVHMDPELLLWPVTNTHQDATNFLVGDSGSIEDGGVLPLLQRGASKIAWFLNTDVGVSRTYDFCSYARHATDGFDPFGKATNQITDKFGYGSDTANSKLSKNQVFPKAELPKLLCEFRNLLQEGRSPVVRTSQQVMPNSYWGITGGAHVDLILVYNEHFGLFEKSLPQDTQDSLASSWGAFKNFPFYDTMSQLTLTAEQVNLLAAHSEHIVRDNSDMFRSVLVPGN